MLKLSKIICLAAVSVITLAASSAANAALVAFTDLATFSAQGTITDSYGFDNWPSGQINFPGPNYNAHGVTYTSSTNEILGAFSGFNNPSAWIANADFAPLTGTISGASNMFAFDLGVFDTTHQLGSTSGVNYTITTNLASYVFNNVVVQNLNTQAETFFGYIAAAGEHFTAFSFSNAVAGSGFGPALDNVTLGTTGVPEPGTLALFGAGLVGLGATRRRRKTKS